VAKELNIKIDAIKTDISKIEKGMDCCHCLP
jgi:hypothetical protein